MSLAEQTVPGTPGPTPQDSSADHMDNSITNSSQQHNGRYFRPPARGKTLIDSAVFWVFLGVAETIVDLLLSWCGCCSVSFRPGRGGTLHMKGVGMLVVSLRGVNFGFWPHLGCSGQNAIIFSCEGLI